MVKQIKKIITKILEWDVHLSEKVFLPEARIFPRKIASFFAHSGDSWFLLAGLFILWIFFSGLTHKYSALFASAIVIQASLVIAIKFLIKRGRPEGNWGSVYRNTDPNSFPSGHAVRAVMLAGMAWGLNIYPLNWILTIWAPLVSFARVMLGVHFLIDILVGWLLGIGLAVSILLLQPVFYRIFPFVF
jgi:undecaprenyl-diphosphatase